MANAVDMNHAIRADDPRPQRSHCAATRALRMQGVGLVLSKLMGYSPVHCSQARSRHGVAEWASLLSVMRVLRSKGIQSRVAVCGATLLPTDSQRIEILPEDSIIAAYSGHGLYRSTVRMNGVDKWRTHR